MTQRKDVQVLLVSLTAVLASACRDDSKPWIGEHVTYSASPSLETCQGTREYVDGFVPFVAGELGIDAPEDLRYSWVTTREIEAAGCLGLTGCADDGHARSTKPALLHEVVHTVHQRYAETIWPFFREGLAVAYDPFDGDGYGPRYVITPEPGEPLWDPRPMMVMDGSELHHFTAGSFVAFLLAWYGPEPLMQMLQALGPERDMEVLRQVFRDSYGTELDAEAERFIVGTECPADAFPVRVYDCAMPEVAWQTADVWAYGNTLDCAEGDLVGGIGPESAWPSIHARTLEVPAAGTYDLRVEGDGELAVVLGRCFGCPWDSPYFVVEPGEVQTVALEAGPHYLRIRGRSDEVARVDVLLQAVTGR